MNTIPPASNAPTSGFLGFDFSHLKGDFLGGLTGAIISLPMGLAFGIQSGLGAQAGLYTAIILAFFAALVGGTKTLLSDPTGPMTILATLVVAGALAHTGGDMEAALVIIISTFVLTGVFQIIFGLVGVSKLVKFMPYPVISGFMGGIGLIIIILQLFPMAGQTSPKGMLNILAHLDDWWKGLNYQALGLSLGTLALIYGLPLLTKKIPSILFALVTLTLISLALPMDVPRIGAIPSGFPEFQLGKLTGLHWSDLSLVVVPALTLAALGTIDTLLTSTVADNLTKTKHNGNRELVGQGLGNIVAALFGSIPGAGATMGTVTNIKTGGRTNLSGIFKAVSLLLIVWGLGTYVQYVPMAVLAGVLIHIGIGIIDVKGLKLIVKAPKADSAILIITLLVTVFDNLLDAVAIGCTLASFVFMKKMSDAALQSDRNGKLCDLLHTVSLPPALAENVFIKHLEGPLFFGFADDFKLQIAHIQNVEVVVMHLDHVPFMDETGILVLEEAILDLENRGIDVYLTGLQPEVKERLHKIGIIPGIIKEEEVFDNFNQCMQSLCKHYQCKQSQQQFDMHLDAALKAQ